MHCAVACLRFAELPPEQALLRYIPPHHLQLLDSLASTYDDDRLALHQQAASLQHHDPYAFTAAAPVGQTFVHGSLAPFAAYGAQLQHGYGSASLPPRPPIATRPSSSIAFGAQGSVLGGGPPLLPRPATSGAVYRSTSEWGQLTATQKEAAQVSLSVLHDCRLCMGP